MKYQVDNKAIQATILQQMIDSPFNIFFVHKSANTIWNVLNKKHGSDDAER